MDADDAMELPGFTTPGHPKADARIIAEPNGEVRQVIADQVPDGPVPDYQIYLSSEYGRRVILHLEARSGQVVKEQNPNSTWRHVLILPLDVAVIYPGTYRLRVLLNNSEIFVKSLTVLNNPALQ